MLLLSLRVEPGVKALGSRHAHVECHHVSSIELAGADPRAPALLSASQGGATESSPGCRVGGLPPTAILGQGDAGMQVWNLNVF